MGSAAPVRSLERRVAGSRPHRPAREGVARVRAVDDLDALAEPREGHGVVADDVAAADREDADFLGRALADSLGTVLFSPRIEPVAGR